MAVGSAWRGKLLMSVLGMGAGLAAVSAHAMQAAAPPVITLCYERANVQPWRTEDGRGLNFELLKLVGERERIRFDFQSMP